MTRDEAIKIVQDESGAKHFIECFVDVLSGLGLLKLDEPKEAIDKLANGMTRAGFNPFTRSELRAILESEGLKLVEK